MRCQVPRVAGDRLGARLTHRALTLGRQGRSFALTFDLEGGGLPAFIDTAGEDGSDRPGEKKTDYDRGQRMVRKRIPP
jgi:hypothetical protein